MTAQAATSGLVFTGGFVRHICGKVLYVMKDGKAVVEKTMNTYTYAADGSLFATCSKCGKKARVIVDIRVAQ